MNAFSYPGQARTQQDVATILNTHSYLGGATLAALERQRGWRGEAESEWLLKQQGVPPRPAASLFALLRQTIGRELVRVGQRLAGSPERGPSPQSMPA